MTDYGQEIIVLARKYNEITGKYPFAGVENRSSTNKLWMFDTGNLHSGAEALGYMRERLAAAQAGRPEPCIARPGEPCLHTPEHTAHRTWAAYGSREAAGSEKPVQAPAAPVGKLTYRDKPAGSYDHDVVPGFSPVTWGDLR